MVTSRAERDFKTMTITAISSRENEGATMHGGIKGGSGCGHDSKS